MGITKQEDWKIIDDMIAYIYQAEPYPDLVWLIHEINKLIPISHSLTCLASDVNEGLEFFNFQSEDIPKEALQSYCNRYYHYDFLLWYSGNPKPLVFRDRDIIREEALEESIFMTEWMQPLGLYYTVMVNIAFDNHLYGNIVLYRSREEEPFSDEELEILRVMNRHLSARFNHLYPNGIYHNTIESEGTNFATKYGLSPRETKIMELIFQRTNRRELGEKLYISENTLKNYLSSIYHKVGVRSYSELINQMALNIDVFKQIENSPEKQHITNRDFVKN